MLVPGVHAQKNTLKTHKEITEVAPIMVTVVYRKSVALYPSLRLILFLTLLNLPRNFCIQVIFFFNFLFLCRH